jgi:hypothetical protein
MQHRKLIALLAVVVTAAFVSIPQGPAGAAMVILPIGTQVGLKFMTPVDSSTVATGTRVHFQVFADVVSGGHVVVRHGTRASGTVTDVTKPGAFGTNAKVVIGYLTTTAVDGSKVHLRDLIVSKAMVSNAHVGAAGAAVAGAVVLGPVGLLAGALVKGGHVSVPAGTAVTDTTDMSARVMTR